MIRMKGPGESVFFALAVLLSLQSQSVADTIYLKSGDVVSTSVERYSDGAFWVKDGRRTYILDPKDILKIVFTRDLESLTSTTPRRSSAPAPKRPAAGVILSVQPASASNSPQAVDDADGADTFGPGLAIINYTAQMTQGIFQVVGEVENRTDTPERYVKVSVSLMDGIGTALDQNFSYVMPGPPHLKSGERKGFRVSFLNPKKGVAKYRIRVESSQY